MFKLFVNSYLMKKTLYGNDLLHYFKSKKKQWIIFFFFLQKKVQYVFFFLIAHNGFFEDDNDGHKKEFITTNRRQYTLFNTDWQDPPSWWRLTCLAPTVCTVACSSSCGKITSPETKIITFLNSFFNKCL